MVAQKYSKVRPKMGFAVGNEINKAIMELELMFMVYRGGD